MLRWIPAGQKWLGMLIAIIAVVAATRPWQLAVAVPTVAGGFGLARIPARFAWE